ncbi:MAG: hypothetical protein CMI30_06580 [Opitutae bacterium]|nr:hypothetical protein [Opitutae bacterium]
MKIKVCFVTGSLSAGKTGVGDYSLLLADACRGKGIDCSTVGLHDPDVDDRIQESGSLRLSSKLPWRQRLHEAREWIERFDPNWISLQFVPYAFHRRGLFRDFLRVFPQFTVDRRLQIMFHEIWIGEFPGAPWTQKVCGALQKRLVRKLLKRTRPEVINHSCAGSEVRLGKAGIKSTHLPIFGNIPLVQTRSKTRFLELLKKAGLKISSEDRENWWILGFFGSIHQDWEVETSLAPILAAAKQLKKKVAVLSLGRLGKAVLKWKEITQFRETEVSWAEIGELEAESMSNALLNLNYGLTSTPWDLVGKSGAIAAMVEHGIPVFVSVAGGTQNAPLVIGDAYRRLIHRVNDDLRETLVAGLAKGTPREGLDMVSDRFLQQLEEKGRAA